MNAVLQAAPMAHALLNPKSLNLVPSPQLMSLFGGQADAGLPDDVFTLFSS